jgi:hypothetical protein
MVSREEDFQLLEHYQAFSAEVVRVSLLAIGAVGALYAIKPADSPLGLGRTEVKCLFYLSLSAFGVAIALSLLHRYVATDFMACQVNLDRLRLAPPAHKSSQEIEKEILEEEKARDTASRLAKRTVCVGPLFLAIGAAFLALAFGFIVGYRA